MVHANDERVSLTSYCVHWCTLSFPTTLETGVILLWSRDRKLLLWSWAPHEASQSPHGPWPNRSLWPASAHGGVRVEIGAYCCYIFLNNVSWCMWSWTADASTCPYEWGDHASFPFKRVHWWETLVNQGCWNWSRRSRGYLSTCPIDRFPKECDAREPRALLKGGQELLVRQRLPRVWADLWLLSGRIFAGGFQWVKARVLLTFPSLSYIYQCKWTGRLVEVLWAGVDSPPSRRTLVAPSGGRYGSIMACPMS
jgi:hypothetical protein